MKKLALGVVVAVGAVIGTFAQTQALPTVDQVLDKFVAAVGGRAAFEKINSRFATGTFEIPDMGISGTIQITEKAPNKAFALVELGGIGTMREGTDGTVAWDDNPQVGLREKAGREAADAKRGATFNQEIFLKTMYPSLAVTGRETVNGRPAIMLTGTPPDSSPVRLYFDDATGLLVRQSATRETIQGPIDFDIYMEDYRDVDGIKQPFMLRQVTAMFTAVIRITEVKHNIPVDDAIFKKPGT